MYFHNRHVPRSLELLRHALIMSAGGAQLVTSLPLLKLIVVVHSVGPDNIVDILMQLYDCMNICMCTAVFSRRDFVRYQYVC